MNAFTLPECDRLRRALRAARDRDGHVLRAVEARQLDRMIARLDGTAAYIAAAEAAICTGGPR